MSEQRIKTVDLGEGWPAGVADLLTQALEMQMPVITSRKGRELRATLRCTEELAQEASRAGLKNISDDVWQWKGEPEAKRSNPGHHKARKAVTRVSGMGDRRLQKEINQRLQGLDDLLRETER